MRTQVVPHRAAQPRGGPFALPRSTLICPAFRPSAKTLQPSFGPPYHLFRCSHRFFIFITAYGFRQTRVSCENREPTESRCLPYTFGYLLASLFQQRQQEGNVIGVRELHAETDQKRLDRLLHGLLGVETQVFVTVWQLVTLMGCNQC